MNLAEILGTNAMISAFILAIIGYTSQIITIHKNGIKGVSLSLFVLTFYTSVSWFIYGIYFKNRNLILPNLLMVLLSLIIIIQIIIKKRNEKISKKVKLYLRIKKIRN